MNKYYHILELDKIIDLVKEEVILDSNKHLLDEVLLMNDLDEINYALDEVDEACVLIERSGRVPLYFHSDVSYLLSKILKNGVLTETELLEISRLLETVKATIIYKETLENAEIKAEKFSSNCDLLIYHKDLNLEIKGIITPYGEIKDDASSLLKDIRRKIRDVNKQIQNKLVEIINKSSTMLTQSIVSIRNERYVISVKNDYKNAIKGIIHDTSSSGETVFIEPAAVVELTNKLNTLHEEEKREIYNILRNISLKIANNYYELKANYDLICHFDLVFGKAKYALSIHATKPKINNEGYIELYKCYHPLLNVENIVTNNISIGKSYQGIIITGPNTGGKTVLLKTIGLLSLMTKMGLLLPCSENSQMMIFDNVFADIGDDQSINQNLSTFSSHLKNLVEILNNVTENSLVLLDEVGSGTDPAEGAALAISIFDTLIEKKCLIMATSHYSELKLHAYNSKNVINASVEFNIETLMPTYKLLLGVPGQSNALKISRMLGLDEKVIEKAEHYAYQKDNDINIILDKIVSQSKEMDEKLTEIEKRNNETKILYAEALEFKEKTEQMREKILEKAEKDALKLIDDSIKKSQEILEELLSMRNKETKLHELSDIKHKIKELKSELEGESFIYEERDHDFKANDKVYVVGYNSYGIITKVLKNNRFEVTIGNASVTVTKNMLKLSKQNNTQEDMPKEKTTVKMPKSVSLSLDLRGERYEEAYQRLEKYLDDVALAGFEQVSIIHGFGTGVIREMVQKYLKSSSLVESYRYGGAGEGGQGATIVKMKIK